MTPSQGEAAVVENDEFTFGEPSALLSEPSSTPSSASRLSQGSSVESQAREEAEAAIEEETETAQGPRQHDAAPAVLEAGSSKAQNRSRSMSPTVTQMAGQAVSERSEDEVNANEGETHDPAASASGSSSQAPTTSVEAVSLQRRQKAARERAPSTDEENAPIPSLRPPTRPLVRVSAQPSPGKISRDGGEQMVLSTSGATWSLQRGTDEPPRKKIRVDSGREAKGKETRVGLRELLKGFARTGSQLPEPSMDVETDAQHNEDVESVGSRDPGVDDADEGGGDGGVHTAQDVDMADPPDTESSEGGIHVDDQPMDEDEDVLVQEVIEIAEKDEDDVPGTTRRSRSDLGTSSSNITSDEIVCTGDHESVSLVLDISRVLASWERLHRRLADARCQEDERGRTDKTEPVKVGSLAGVGDTADDTEAVEALSRVIDKADFAGMEVVGQFNLGFVIVRRRKVRYPDTDGRVAIGTDMDDLFIVDQHAADEKYNFEALQRTTKIDSQKLFRYAPSFLQHA